MSSQRFKGQESSGVKSARGFVLQNQPAHIQSHPAHLYADPGIEKTEYTMRIVHLA